MAVNTASSKRRTTRKLDSKQWQLHLDKDGNPDTTQVTIAYAGTNPTDIEDIKTDIFSVGLGMRTHQMMQADIFANYIKTTYNPADLSFTGHSLGGYEAMSMAGKYRGSATTFNAPNATNDMDSPTQAYVARNPRLFNNYIVSNDKVGNFGMLGGNALGTTIYTGDLPTHLSDKDSWLAERKNELFGATHGLDKFRVDADGNILTTDGKIARKQDALVSEITQHVRAELYGIPRSSMTSEFAYHSAQAEVIAAVLEEIAVFASEEFEDHAHRAYDATQILYNDTISHPIKSISCLDANEIRETLAEAGITHTSYVESVEDHFRYALKVPRSIAQDFNTLHQKMIDASGRVTSADMILGHLTSGRTTQLPHKAPKH